MGRRKTDAEKANLRFAADFYTYQVSPCVSDALVAYWYVAPFPIQSQEILSRYLDRCFGDPTMCALACKTWALYDESFIAVGNYQPRDGEPNATSSAVAGPRSGKVSIVVAGDMRLSFSVPQFTLAREYPFGAHLSRRLNTNASESDRELAVQISDWAVGVSTRQEESARAVEFLDKLVNLADSTHSLFHALPGLRGVSETLGVHRHVVEEVAAPYRGHDNFNKRHSDAMMPLWRTRWSEEVRPLLLKVAAAKASATHGSNYLPSEMYIDARSVTR